MHSILDYANPTRFLNFARIVLPWLGGVTLLLLVVGLYGAFTAPPDYQQGETVRIMYIHVPAAWLAIFAYVVMISAALGVLVWKHPLADAAQKTAAGLGAAFTFVCLVTGSLWGKPMWGTYWVWDARLTSTLILLFLYLGYIALQAAIDDTRRADKASAVLALVGVVNVPIIYFSVKWWNTLHQGASVKPGSSTMASTMLTAMMIMVFAFWAMSIAIALYRARVLILEREKRAQWAQELVAAGKA